MESVTSADGTAIAYSRGGGGPALILVHGTGVDHHVWDDVVPTLSESFEVYAIDRRGRGESGDTEEYSIEHEFDDIAALAASIDGPVNVVAHSYGAICAVGAAQRVSELRRLVLYEPPLWRGDGSPSPPPEQRRMRELVDRGDYQGVLETYWVDMRGEPDRFQRLKSRSDYDRRVDVAHTFPREMSGRREFRPTPETYPAVEVPTLLLTGSETHDSIKRSVAATAALFPDGETVEIDGCGHAAMNTAPERFVSEVVDFLVDG
ncbi:alpha/beta fold hydrolase [Halobellus salinisoli]|uniref:alpha/beta fold hydrolase n=1 Tax=Halobellus salinisoli TaxID=3108500 RepID=UPI0030087649